MTLLEEFKGYSEATCPGYNDLKLGIAFHAYAFGMAVMMKRMSSVLMAKDEGGLAAAEAKMMEELNIVMGLAIPRDNPDEQSLTA